MEIKILNANMNIKCEQERERGRSDEKKVSSISATNMLSRVAFLQLFLLHLSNWLFAAAIYAWYDVRRQWIKKKYGVRWITRKYNTLTQNKMQRREMKWNDWQEMTNQIARNECNNTREIAMKWHVISLEWKWNGRKQSKTKWNVIANDNIWIKRAELKRNHLK